MNKNTQKMRWIKNFFQATTSFIALANAAIMTSQDRERQELQDSVKGKMDMTDINSLRYPPVIPTQRAFTRKSKRN